MSIRVPTLIAAVVVLVAACGGSDTTDLQSYELPGPQLMIDRPADWLAVTEGRATIFAETQEALDAAYRRDPPPATALTIVFDHRDLGFMAGIGAFPGGETAPTPADLFEFNAANFRWEVIGDTGTVEVLGLEAVRARVVTEIGVSEVIQGMLPGGEEVFLLELSAPDGAALDGFAPVWEAIIASLVPAGRP